MWFAVAVLIAVPLYKIIIGEPSVTSAAGVPKKMSLWDLIY